METRVVSVLAMLVVLQFEGIFPVFFFSNCSLRERDYEA
jgi:hypothetical protein